MAVGSNVIYDPTKEELAVAEAVLAVSIAAGATDTTSARGKEKGSGRGLRIVAVRTIDPPSRLTPPGVPNALNPATGGASASSTSERETVADDKADTVWSPPRGGMKRAVLRTIIKQVTERRGVGEEVLDGLDAVDIG